MCVTCQLKAIIAESCDKLKEFIGTDYAKKVEDMLTTRFMLATGHAEETVRERLAYFLKSMTVSFGCDINATAAVDSWKHRSLTSVASWKERRKTAKLATRQTAPRSEMDLAIPIYEGDDPEVIIGVLNSLNATELSRDTGLPITELSEVLTDGDPFGNRLVG